MAAQSPEPRQIRQIVEGVYRWYAMDAAMRLDLFSELGPVPLPSASLADTLHVQERHLQPLLDNLVHAELLTCTDGQYANGEEAQRFLVRGSADFMGATFELWSEFWDAIEHTAATIRTGVPQAQHDYSQMSEEALYAWMRPINDTAIRSAHAMLRRYDFGAYHSLLDVGGGMGGLSVTLAYANPGLHATILDLPTVTPLAERYLIEEGMRDRVDVSAVDLVEEAPGGQYDAAVLLRFLQCFSTEDAQTILQHVGAALRPGGMIIIAGIILDDSRLAPANAVHVNLLFLNIYDGGQSHTEAQHREWLRGAGFTEIRRDATLGILDVIVARKS